MAEAILSQKALQDFPFAGEMDKSMRRDMMHFIIALMFPVSIGAYLWGISMLRAVVICVVSSVLTERLCNVLQGRKSTIGDLTAVITGIVISLNMRPGLGSYPLLLTGIVGIGVGKMMFGGAGFNIINPAVIGRLLPVAGFPGLWATSLRPTIPTLMQYGGLSYWEANQYVFVRDIKALPFYAEKIQPLFAKYSFSQTVNPYYDILSGTSYLETVKSWYKSGAMPEGMLHPTQFMDYWHLFSGMHLPGVMGESAKWAILLGFVYLVATKVIKPGVPLLIWGMAMAFGWIFGAVRVGPAGYGPIGFFAGDPLHWVLIGGVLLGSVYMETDPITSPITNLGKFVYALIFTTVVGCIRLFFSFPEGVSFALLTSNLLLPFILRWTDPQHPKYPFYRKALYTCFALIILSFGMMAIYQVKKNSDFIASVKGLDATFADANVKQNNLIHYTISKDNAVLAETHLVSAPVTPDLQVSAMIAIKDNRIIAMDIISYPVSERKNINFDYARFVGKSLEEISGETDVVALCAQKALQRGTSSQLGAKL
ncbi:MAG: RnfABCDGE type electron transport complex subunit D [Brevinema sp.]